MTWKISLIVSIFNNYSCRFITAVKYVMMLAWWKTKWCLWIILIFDKCPWKFSKHPEHPCHFCYNGYEASGCKTFCLWVFDMSFEKIFNSCKRRSRSFKGRAADKLTITTTNCAPTQDYKQFQMWPKNLSLCYHITIFVVVHIFAIQRC